MHIIPKPHPSQVYPLHSPKDLNASPSQRENPQLSCVHQSAHYVAIGRSLLSCCILLSPIYEKLI